MLVGIIAANNLRLSPYAFYYEKILTEMNVDFEFIVPTRNEHLVDDYVQKINYLRWDDKKHSLFNYMNYSKQVMNECVKKYDFLIVLTTVNAVFLYPWLKKYFCKKYIVDIRDYTYEKNKIFCFIEKLVLSNSKLNVISSKKFETFLPLGKYYVAHNISNAELKANYKLQKGENPIVIGYVGAIAYYAQCVKLIDMIEKDNRFRLHFYGTGVAEKRLVEYVENNNYKNTVFWGAYKAHEKGQIVKKVDILFNCYGNGVPLLDYALSNKLYDSFYYHVPILTSPNTYMQEMAGCMSYAMDLDQERNLNSLWKWYTDEIDMNELDAYADEMFRKVQLENKETIEKIKEVIIGG